MKKGLFGLLAAILLATTASSQVSMGNPFGGGGSGTSAVETRGGTLLDPTGAVDVVVWRAPYTCTVNKIQSLQVGGTSGTVNARKNGTDALLASDLATTAGTWASSSTIQNASVAVDDYLEIQIVTLVGTPTGVTIQIECQP